MHRGRQVVATSRSRVAEGLQATRSLRLNEMDAQERNDLSFLLGKPSQAPM